MNALHTALLLALLESADGFSGGSAAAFVSRRRNAAPTTTTLFSTVPAIAFGESTRTTPDGDDPTHQAVRVPLKFLGPYPCIGLNFPNLATASQRTRNVTGVSLDFVLDTAANTNTLNSQVAKELDLPVIGEAPPGLGAAGPIQGGTTYMLGDCELEGMPSQEEQFTFLKDLTASGLPLASPASAGLLSLPFFLCFEGGVEFGWGSRSGDDDALLVPPSVTFYGEGESDDVISEMTKVPVKELPLTRLPSIEITINGATFPALLDTGSPITVLNAQAAKEAGIQKVDVPSNVEEGKSNNPFANIANRFKNAQAISQAAGRGDVLTLAGANGQPVNLLKSAAKGDIRLGSEVDFGRSHVYVGDLPGLAALNALGEDSPPAAVLGMDVLRMKPKMLFRPQDKEVYF